MDRPQQKVKLFGYFTILTLLVVGILNFVLLSTTNNVLNGGSLFEVAFASEQIGATQDLVMVATLLIVFAFVAVGLTLISLFDAIKDKTNLMLTAIIANGVVIVFYIIVSLIFGFFTQGVLLLICATVIILVIALALFVSRRKLIYFDEDGNKMIEVPETDEKRVSKIPEVKKLARYVLIYNVVVLVLLATMFFIPLFTIEAGGVVDSYFLIDGFQEHTNIFNLIYSFTFTSLYLASIFVFILSLSSFISSKPRYIKNTKGLLYLNIAISFIYFVTGLGTAIYHSYTTAGIISSTISFLPLLLIACTSLLYAFLKGKFDFSTNMITAREFKKGAVKFHFERLVYVTIMTIGVYAILFLEVFNISYTYAGTTDTIKLTGLELLQQYNTLGGGYQLLAFMIITMLITSTLLLIVNIAAYFAKTKQRVIFTGTTVFNIGTIFLLSISSLYFIIAQEINVENIEIILGQHGIPISADYSYSIANQVIFVLFADVAILIAALFTDSFSRENDYELEFGPTRPSANGEPVYAGDGGEATGPQQNQNQGSGSGSSQQSEANRPSGTGNSLDQPKLLNFDPCPTFTQIDRTTVLLGNELKEKEKLIEKTPSLERLVAFVVQYAKNSKSKLSYTRQNIATFVAGIGTSRLTILQGLSGTGKTSLPKIFQEAIMGECNIIEVESSWKDKNELLGYYNEFTQTYTPKKFTQALYKAALNKNVPTFIVLDEMNLSRIEYYFSDFLSLMEHDENKREIKLVNIELKKTIDGKETEYAALTDANTLKIPPNIWFIGTANRDESTFVISDKVYDRAHTMNFNKRAVKVRDAGAPLQNAFYTTSMLVKLLSDAKKAGNFDAERSQLIREVETILTPYNITFGNRILNQIESFVDIYRACFPGKEVTHEAIETILLSKVVTKLEVKSILNKNSLARQFEKLNLLKCSAFVNSLDED